MTASDDNTAGGNSSGGRGTDSGVDRETVTSSVPVAYWRRIHLIADAKSVPLENEVNPSDVLREALYRYISFEAENPDEVSPGKHSLGWMRENEVPGVPPSERSERGEE
jgi:hypothetical protein